MLPGDAMPTASSDEGVSASGGAAGASLVVELDVSDGNKRRRQLLKSRTEVAIWLNVKSMKNRPTKRRPCVHVSRME